MRASDVLSVATSEDSWSVVYSISDGITVRVEQDLCPRTSRSSVYNGPNAKGGAGVSKLCSEVRSRDEGECVALWGGCFHRARLPLSGRVRGPDRSPGRFSETFDAVGSQALSSP